VAAWTRDEWIAAFARQIGVDPPTPEEVDVLLELAAIAAHSSERTAAPLACWLAGRCGESPQGLKGIAEGIGER
jgi:Domain of unknown function (DUF6457)